MIEQLIETGRRIVASGIAKGWAGNLSARYRGNFIITRSGADLGNLEQSDIVFIRPQTSQLSLQARRPSSELSLHLAIYKEHPDTQVVIHVHSPQSIAFGLLGMGLPALTPDFYRYVGALVPVLPFIPPTTQELATAVAQALSDSSAVLLQNHGVVVIGESVSQALLRLNLLEEQAGIYMAALAAGTPRQLWDADLEKLDELLSRKQNRNA
ncbi:MAG: class II aldolase/adducin family protein [Ardenticatenaceae bacterium]|nr:class II aldolase/adducin family protein [Ardenticatenaceae bacterium]MCB9443096.1 class II aldolase/adducin family protein [Ardenticatenaceae bacterium]